MYCDFYNLTEKPFNVTPDPKFLYLNARYREALASLHYGISERKGFITLIGEAGTGKTTLLNKLLEQLEPNTRTVLIFNTNVTFEDILEYIFAEFDLPVHSGKKLYMLQRLNAFLLDELRGGGNVALLIDEAQDLDHLVLEDLRLLSNLETAKEKILQIILSGQTELGQKLADPGLRQLRQRIAVNCRLMPLSRDEITEYIQFRLRAAGCSDPKVFTRDAEDEIWTLSRGIPRLVNVVCDNALVIGYALAKKRIGADVVREAAADMIAANADESPIDFGDGEPARAEVSAPTPVMPAAATEGTRRRGTWMIFAVVAMALMVGLISMGRSMLRDHEQVSAPPPAAARPREVMRPGADPIDEPPVAIGSERSSGTAPRGSTVDEPPNARRAGVPPGGTEEMAPEEEAAPSKDDLGRIQDQGPAVAGFDPSVGSRAEAADVIQEDLRPTRSGAARVAAKAEQPPSAEEPTDSPSRSRVTAPAAAALEAEDRAVADAPPPPAAPKPQQNAARPAAEEAIDSASDWNPPPAPERAPRAPGRLARAELPSAASEATTTLDPAAEINRVPAEPAKAPEVVVTETSDSSGGARLVAPDSDSVVARAGDSVGQIAARKYGQASYTILDLLTLANPGLHDVDQISVGQTITLPELSKGFSVFRDGGKGYGVLIFSSPSAERTKALAQALRSGGFDAQVERTSLGAQKTVYRVSVGPSATPEEAANVGRSVQRAFREDQRLGRLALD